MATFFIKTDKEYYTAGETVTGQVLLAVSSNINGCVGVSLTFTAFESLKWMHTKPIPQPPSQPITNNPSKQAQSVFPAQQIHQTDMIEISECGTQQNSNNSLRPKFIRNAKNELFEVEYNERRNNFAKQSVRILESSKILAGHYSFPFSFKTFEDWPGSLTLNSESRKAQICYKLSASIDPVNPHFDFQAYKQVIIVNKSSEKKAEFHNEITSCSCFAKGRTTYKVQTAQDLYSTDSSNAKIVIQIDNSECTTDINNIDLSFTQSIEFHQEAQQQKIQKVLLTANLGGVRAQEKCINEKAITYNIDLSKLEGIISSSSGRFITSQNLINITLNYDAALYSARTETVPIKIRSKSDKIEVHPVFLKDFNPKTMPQVSFKFQSTFKNPNLSNGFASTQKFNTP